jgi:hypothetical protein
MLAPLIPVPPGRKGAPYLKDWGKLPPEVLDAELKKRPGCNVGLRLDHFLALDADDQGAYDFLDKLEQEGRLPPTVAWTTWRNRTVRLYRRTDGLQPIKPPTGSPMMLEVRTGPGQYVIIPPSQVNGRSYKWVPYLSPMDVEPTDLLPETLSMIRKALQKPESRQETRQSGRPSAWAALWQGVPEGSRDDTAAKLAGRLLNRGLPQSEVIEILTAWDARNAPSLGLRDIAKVVNSVARAEASKENTSFFTRELSTRVDKALRQGGFSEEEIDHLADLFWKFSKRGDDFNFSAEVREWVLSTKGHFLSTDVHRELALSTLSTDQRRVNKTLSQILSRLCEEGIIERVRDRRGCFRRIERESEALDFLNADCSTIFDLKWPSPFHLERLVNLYPKNIVVVAGDSNAGKTALLLNVIRMNMNKLRIAYFSSEMGPEELRLRLENFQMPVNEWKFEAYERAANFADAVIPDAVNIIDYLELTDNFYQVAGEIKAVFDRLTTGVALIALQKKEGATLGRGGDFSQEKARLYLSMGAGELKIVKGKNWAMKGVNPAGKVFKFKLVDGCKFLQG